MEINSNAKPAQVPWNKGKLTGQNLHEGGSHSL